MTTGQASSFRAGYIFIGFSPCYLVGVGSRWAEVLVKCPAGESPRRARQRLRPLEVFKKQIEKRKRGRRRTNRVALFPNRYEEEILFDIGLACARLWNELNYEKRKAFFNRELLPEKRDKINEKYYHEKYLDAMYKKNERLRHLYITATRFLADELYRRGVRKLYIGYPIMLSRTMGTSITLIYGSIGR